LDYEQLVIIGKSIVSATTMEDEWYAEDTF
jgi:hypothetical protein